MNIFYEKDFSSNQTVDISIIILKYVFKKKEKNQSVK